MDVRKLEAFCRVYELKSFSKAGEVMYLSQPTVSSHVADLEEELGVRLFDRLGRSIIPTQAGDVLYGRAVSVFENLERARASIEALKDRVVGDLNVGCSTIPSHHILPAMVAEFSNKYPDVCFTVHSAGSVEVVEKVARGEWPVGIVGFKPTENGLDAKLIAEDETMVVAAPDAPWLGGRTHFSIKEAIRLPWIMRGHSSATRQALIDALKRAGVSTSGLNVRCQVEGTCESLSHAETGVGLCFTSKLAATAQLNRGDLVALDIPELKGKREFYLIHHSGRHLFPALKAFVEFDH